MIKNPDTGWRGSYTNIPGKDYENDWTAITDGVNYLAEADEVIGHNIMDFDLPVLERLHGLKLKPGCKVTDTLIISRLIWTNLMERDSVNAEKGKFPSKLIGSHSLEAWGHRLGVLKGSFNSGGADPSWEVWTPEMQSYCEQDVEVNLALLKLIEKQNYSEQAIDLEHRFRAVIRKMELHGIRFDEAKAAKLYGELAQRKAQLTAELQTIFEPTIIKLKTKTKTIPFNPGSRPQIADRLIKRGWKPEKTTDTGKPQVDEKSLESLDIPGAKQLLEYLTIEKRLGMLAEGQNAWMKLSRNGRIHGRVNTNGAVTGRCTHSTPNMAQVPSVALSKEGKLLYGHDGLWATECRELFAADEGMVLVGGDASGLELRNLAHYLAKWDGGEYARVVLEGDVHTANQIAFGLPEGKVYRNECAKGGIYCLVYGGGDWKLGITLFPPHLFPGLNDNQYKTKGLQARNKFRKAVPSFGKLVDAVKATAAAKGFLLGLDGRRLLVRSQHSALNTLLQSAGALIVKLATVIVYEEMLARGYQFGKDWALLLHVHDEMQCQARPEIADELGKLIVWAFGEAARRFNFRIRIDGEYKIGRTWADTH